MFHTLLKYIFKYLLFGIIIYLLITYIPNQPLKNPEYLTIFTVILFSIVILDITINYNKLVNI